MSGANTAFNMYPGLAVGAAPGGVGDVAVDPHLAGVQFDPLLVAGRGHGAIDTFVLHVDRHGLFCSLSMG